LRLEQILVCARCREAGQDRYQHAQPDERDGCCPGSSLTNKVLQLCNGWLMETKRADGSPGIVYVEPKTKTIVDVDFR
jgi:hypothetical protein